MWHELSETDAELVKRFQNNFARVATIQGRVAYLAMSVHAIHPHFLSCYVTNSATQLLYFNMVYGISMMIFSRANMKVLALPNRFSFSILGSLMFNYSSMAVFNWIRKSYSGCVPYLASFLGLLAGRIFMLHLLAFLYHVDIESDSDMPRNEAFDALNANYNYRNLTIFAQ